MANTPYGPRRHETRALLRAHLAAASAYRHATRHCPICHRLLRLAMESGPDLPADLPAAPPADLPPPPPVRRQAAKDVIRTRGRAGK
ncbi:hypothetical protein DVA86_21380 [Streptomyces armeniacus]|uniref:Uncharacterized protein n=1 Tax=Streptomyces armeniacus TaxID=83291 RepID=A0A345XT54_9ACTN|nr:DUF6274 family protein [Streptomyces armeniacus]AXK34820.1 hypothetical protein DVA86_21380 [Streptomyces armeniacus]